MPHSPDRPQRVVIHGTTGLTIGMLGVALFFFAIAAVVLWAMYPGLPQPANRSWGMYFGVVVPVALLMAGIGAPFVYLMVVPHLFVRYELTPAGITRTGPFSRAFWPWDSVAAFWYNGNGVYLKGRRPRSAVFTLDHRDGGRMTIRGECISDHEAFGAALEAHMTAVQTPSSLRALGEGRSLPFGPLTVTREGLTDQTRRLPWSDLASVELVDGGDLVVSRADGWEVWFRCRMSKVPNLCVLFAVVGELMRGGAAADDRPVEVDGAELATGPQWSRDELSRAELPELGAPRSECRPRTNARRARAGAYLCFPLSLVAILAAVWYAYFSGVEPVLPPRIVVFLGGLLMLGLDTLGLMLLNEADAADQSVLIFREGFARVGRDKVWLCPWDRVRRVFADVSRVMANGALSGVEEKYTVERDDGQQVVVTHVLNNASRFAEELGRRTHGRLLRQALDAHREGLAVDFGPIRVSAKGVALGGALVPWASLAGVQLQDGWLRLRRMDGKQAASCRAADVANLFVLLELLEQRQGETSSGSV